MHDDFERENKRIALRALALVGTDDQRGVLLELIDVSAGGVRVRTGPLPLQKGDVIQLELEVDGESIEAKGEVRNIDEGRQEAGIMFVEISEDAIVTLETLSSSEAW